VMVEDVSLSVIEFVMYKQLINSSSLTIGHLLRGNISSF